MNKKLHLPFVVLMVIFGTSPSFAQKILQKANKQFEMKHFHEAIDSYIKTLQTYPDNLEARSNLAESYRLTNQLDKAVDVYAQIMSEEFLDPIHIRNYGITLMKMAKYNEAHYQFELYKIYNPQEAQHYQLSCEYAHHLYKTHANYEVELVNLNTKNSDFGVAFIDDKLVFSSFRQDIEMSDDAKLSGQSLAGNMIYIGDLSDNLKVDNVKFLRSGIAEKKNIGPISFSTQRQICAFTRNKIQNGGAHVIGDDSYHSIYIADLLPSGDWNTERPFRYNEFGTSTGFPSLTFDGKALYFASNRVGGYGGYDIYVSYYKENDWTYPENLGEHINTPGNEITPFFNGEDLYFSSDYHHGMGGYDIFHSTVQGGVWSHPQNMANGVNSPADDYYPAIKEGTNGVFFSSNRLGGRGMDDIYLAIPSQEKIDLASASFKPEPVSLMDIDSKIDYSAKNSLARSVANDASIEVKVFKSNDNEPKVADRNTPNDQLPMWGFTPEKETVVNDPRPELVCQALPRVSLSEVYSDQEITMLDGSNLHISITDQNSESAIEVMIAHLTIEIAEHDNRPIAVENTASEVVEMVVPQEEALLTDIATIDVKPESYKLPEYKELAVSKAPLNLDLEGARRVALGEMLPVSDVYFIQLASLSNSKGNVSNYKALAKYGNLYKVFNTNTTKIKLGYFLDREEAASVLRNVKSRGFKDAFITKDDLSAIQLELIIANDQVNGDYLSYQDKSSTRSADTEDYSLHNRPKNTYKVRLASYEDPIWFDIEGAKSLGSLEQWTKGSWTIFILGGYETFDDAEAARIRAINKGFTDAEVVIDDNGILQRLKKN